MYFINSFVKNAVIISEPIKWLIFVIKLAFFAFQVYSEVPKIIQNGTSLYPRFCEIFENRNCEVARFSEIVKWLFYAFWSFFAQFQSSHVVNFELRTPYNDVRIVISIIWVYVKGIIITSHITYHKYLYEITILNCSF